MKKPSEISDKYADLSADYLTLTISEQDQLASLFDSAIQEAVKPLRTAIHEAKAGSLTADRWERIVNEAKKLGGE